MRFPKASREIAKVAVSFTINLGFLTGFCIAVYTMFAAEKYHWRELTLAVFFLITAAVILYKVSKSLIESLLKLLEGIDTFMKSILEDYFEVRDYYIMKHGEYQAGLYFRKRSDEPIRSWEFDFEKRINEVNSNYDASRAREAATKEREEKRGVV